MAEDITIDPTGSFFTNTNKTLDAWKADLEQQKQLEQVDLEGVDIESILPGSVEAANVLASQAVKDQTEAGPDLTRTAESLAEHSGFDRLSLGTTFNKGELEDKNDPRWKHVYDTNNDGVVDNRDDYGRDMMNFGRKRDATTVAMERQHAYESGTGKAGLATNIIETKNAIAGTSLDLINGLITLPETTVRTLAGQEFDRSQLWFDPVKAAGIENPWQGTSLGHTGRVLAGFGVGGYGAHGILSKAGWYNKLKTTAGGRTLQNMISEAAFMKTSVYRQDPTAFNALQDQLYKLGPEWGDALNWIAIGEYDHPIVKEVKGLAEAAGIPGLFGALFLSGRAGVRFVDTKFFKPKLGTKISDANEFARITEDPTGQSLANAKHALDTKSTKQLDLNLDGETRASDFNADVNTKIANDTQGIKTSTNTGTRILSTLNELDNYPTGLGSTDSPITELQAKLAATDVRGATEVYQNTLKSMLGEPYFRGLVNDINANKLNITEVFRNSFERFEEIIGRDAGDMSIEEFYKPILNDFQQIGKTDKNLTGETFESWALTNVVANDLINSSLFQDLRIRAKAAREIDQVADIFAIDGAMKGIADRLIFGLSSVKRSRYLLSEELARLPGIQRAQAIAERTAALHDETVDGVRLMMQFLRASDSRELAQGVLEVFSMSNKIRNWKDFDAWMRQKLLGGDFANKNKEGALTRELGGVMVNSILSGPKTPLRAIMGTTANAYLNEVTTLLGAGLKAPFGGDRAILRASAASTKAMFQLIPDAFKVFKSNLNSYFSADISTIRSRYSTYTKSDQNWDLMGEWAERNGTSGEKAAYYMANTARKLNDNKFLTYSSRVMGATDESFRWLLSKARSRKKALLTVMNENPNIDVSPAVLKKAEDIEFAKLHDAEGNIDITKDAFLERNYREVTLTTELKGFSEGLDSLMNRYPLTKPFFLFARTGINGLRLSVKHLPVVGAIVNESREILQASAKSLQDGSLMKYGIETVEDLASAKNMVIGRQAIGISVVSLAAHKYMSGGLTGNGPADASMKKMWIDSGWSPRSINIGGTWVSYDAFEPFNLVLANIADVGDNMNLMGPQFSEQRLQLVVAALGKGATSKTYLQGIGQLFDLLSGDAGYASQKILANLVNNQVPLAGLRNEIGNILNPNMRELDADFWTHIKNRNALVKGTLPIKYDMLNGKPIRDWNFFESAFNAVSPIQFRMDKGRGRRLLWNSNYDTRILAYTAPDGTSLRKSPEVRSLLQKAIGDTNLEEALNNLYDRPDVQASLKAMEEDISSGKTQLDPMKAYLHNRLIKLLITKHQKIGWASIRNHPLVQELKAKEALLRSNNLMSYQNTLLNIPK